MLEPITSETLSHVRTPEMRDYARIYLDVYRQFARDVEQFGLPFARQDPARAEAEALRRSLPRKGVQVRSGGASLVWNWLSTACEACRRGQGSETMLLSLRCHRDCFFCFNPNQEDYPRLCTQMQDWCGQLDRLAAQGGRLTHLALTGGEPLLYPQQAVEFFARARELFPGVHLRLYTSGDLLTEPLARQLRQAGLEEVRFSVKQEDPAPRQEQVLQNLERAVGIFPDVLVEMPVFPGSQDWMRQLLLRLDRAGARGINLLELCFPYNNAPEFARRGLELRWPPYQTLYNFWYAGGLPVAGSEVECLRLLDFAAGQKLRLGVHYCSLENKNTGQVWQQNHQIPCTDPTLMPSEKDFYLKTLKVFGDEARRALPLLRQAGCPVRVDPEHRAVQFHPRDLVHLEGDPEIGVSYQIMELRDGAPTARELRLDRTTRRTLRPEDL